MSNSVPANKVPCPVLATFSCREGGRAGTLEPREEA